MILASDHDSSAARTAQNQRTEPAATVPMILVIAGGLMVSSRRGGAVMTFVLIHGQAIVHRIRIS